MSKKLSEKNIGTNEKSEKFFLKQRIYAGYNGIGQRKNNAFTHYLAQKKMCLVKCAFLPLCVKGGRTRLCLLSRGNAC